MLLFFPLPFHSQVQSSLGLLHAYLNNFLFPIHLSRPVLPPPPSSVLFLSLTLLIYHLFFPPFFADPLLILMLRLSFFHPFLPAPKFLQPSPDSLHTSVLTFITVGCADKRISHLRLHQSCHVRSVQISEGGLGRRKCLKVSHKNSFIH